MSDSKHAPVVKPLTGAAAHDHSHGHDGHYDHDDVLAHGGDDHSHGGLGKYIAVFIALCVLTAMSFATFSEFWPFGKHVTWAFMMAVSCTKAMLVILFFMHVMYEANWKYVLTIPAGMMSIFLILMLVPDIGLRNNWASDERINNMANVRDLNPRHSKNNPRVSPGPVTTPNTTPPAVTDTIPQK
jgi:cytochrome c oxidase subunit 4